MVDWTFDLDEFCAGLGRHPNGERRRSADVENRRDSGALTYQLPRHPPLSPEHGRVVGGRLSQRRRLTHSFRIRAQRQPATPITGRSNGDVSIPGE